MSLVRFGNSALKSMKEFNLYLQFEGRVKYLELNYVNVVIYKTNTMALVLIWR